MGYLLEEAHGRREGGLEMEGRVQVLQMMTIFESRTRVWCGGGCFILCFVEEAWQQSASMWEEEEEGREQGAGSIQRVIWRRSAPACSHTRVREIGGRGGGAWERGEFFPPFFVGGC
jgi:hypothetical protein